jgi:hypothetical protein
LDTIAFQYGFKQIQLDDVACVNERKFTVWHSFSVCKGYDRNRKSWNFPINRVSNFSR